MDDSFLCARYTGFDPVRAALGEVLPLINQTTTARSVTNRKALLSAGRQLDARTLKTFALW